MSALNSTVLPDTPIDGLGVENTVGPNRPLVAVSRRPIRKSRRVPSRAATRPPASSMLSEHDARNRRAITSSGSSRALADA
jgi:hypothetical protein